MSDHEGTTAPPTGPALEEDEQQLLRMGEVGARQRELAGLIHASRATDDERAAMLAGLSRLTNAAYAMATQVHQAAGLAREDWSALFGRAGPILRYSGPHQTLWWQPGAKAVVVHVKAEDSPAFEANARPLLAGAGMRLERCEAADLALNKLAWAVTFAGATVLVRARALGLVALRHLRDAEMTPALAAETERVLDLYRDEPHGSEYLLEVGGRRYVACLEGLYHEPGGPKKPWGYHTGLMLFAVVVLGPGESAHAERT